MTFTASRVMKTVLLVCAAMSNEAKEAADTATMDVIAAHSMAYAGYVAEATEYKLTAEHIGRRLSAADKEPRSNMTLPMQVKTICLNKESREEIPTRTHDKKRRVQQESQAPSSTTSRAIGPHSMTIGAPRRAPPHNFPERAMISE